MAASSPVQRMLWTKDMQIASVLHAMAESRDEEAQAEMRAVGMRIKRLREARGWNQDELAHKIGVSNATISRWERGATAGQRPHIRKLAKALEVTPEEIRPPIEESASGLLDQFQRIEDKLDEVLRLLSATVPDETPEEVLADAPARLLETNESTDSPAPAEPLIPRAARQRKNA